ncbi:hypothetical protein FS749_013604 [Ceratobasidium sp. UAMH 11750]|nr:hypothetical protein FS749_013604 [Ceratobasidium sp. UAMH 11750]
MSLTTTMGVKLGPIVLGTLFKHYLERHTVIRDSKARNELLFDEAFIVVKSFLEESSKHTVEELQQFSNTRIPAPPWVHNVRVLIPLSCCDEAAPLLLQALGGPEAVGGSKWWQASPRRTRRRRPVGSCQTGLARGRTKTKAAPSRRSHSPSTNLHP